MIIKDLKEVCISPEATIKQAITCIDGNRKGIALIVSNSMKLLGTLTDGDIRRAILNGVDLNRPAKNLLERKAGNPIPRPVVAQTDAKPAELLSLMQMHGIRQIPIVDKDERVCDLIILADLMPGSQDDSVQAVIMAGGFGTRMRPITEDLPKPMLPVGDRPLLEHIITQLRDADIKHLYLTTHYLASKIKDYFGNGQKFGVELHYINEEKPLGTAGALGLLAPPNRPVLVINGDILTKVDFKAFLAFHLEHEASLTMGVRKYDMDVPYGVVESDGPFINKLVEKPVQSFFVNAGIYLLQPEVWRRINEGEVLDMTDLVQRLLGEGAKVASFPIHEYWVDIGQMKDYEKAQEDVRNGNFWM